MTQVSRHLCATAYIYYYIFFYLSTYFLKFVKFSSIFLYFYLLFNNLFIFYLLIFFIFPLFLAFYSLTGMKFLANLYFPLVLIYMYPIKLYTIAPIKFTNKSFIVSIIPISKYPFSIVVIVPSFE